MGRLIRAGEPRRARVPAEVADARSEAARIVGAARAEADRVRAEAAARGRREAEVEAAARLLQAAAAAERLRAHAEGELPRLAVAVARRLIGDALEDDPSRVRAVVAQALERARRARRIEIHAHPDDVPHLRSVASGSETTVAVVPDPSVGRGGCVLHTDVGEVDARIEVQLAALEQALSSEG